MLGFDEATYLSLLFNFILPVRLSNILWGSYVLLFLEFMNIVFIFVLYLYWIHYIVIYFLLILFSQYKQSRCALSSPKLKKFLYFLKKYLFLHFGIWNFLTVSLKTVLYFFRKKLLLYFGKWNFLALSLENSYIFSKRKFLYISGENFIA